MSTESGTLALSEDGDLGCAYEAHQWTCWRIDRVENEEGAWVDDIAYRFYPDAPGLTAARVLEEWEKEQEGDDGE